MPPWHWLLRMSQWARNPPSWKSFRFVMFVVAICAAIYGFELVFGWPEALTPDKIPRRGLPVTEL